MWTFLYYVFIAFLVYVFVCIIAGFSSGMIRNIKLRKKQKRWKLERDAQILEDKKRRMEFDPAHLDKTPDYPCLGGYKAFWLEVKTEDPEKVVNRLGLENVHTCNWKSSFQAIGYDYLFVSPSVQGWVFVVSNLLPEIRNYEDEDSYKVMMEKLATEFSEVHYYGNYRSVDYYAWGKYVNGKEVRAFSTSDGESVQRGEVTSEELSLDKNMALGIIPEELPEEDSEEYKDLMESQYLDEEDVLQMAELWSLNPMKFDDMDVEELNKGVGFIGKLKI